MQMHCICYQSFTNGCHHSCLKYVSISIFHIVLDTDFGEFTFIGMFVSHRGFGFVLLSICEKPFLWSRFHLFFDSMNEMKNMQMHCIYYQNFTNGGHHSCLKYISISIFHIVLDTDFGEFAFIGMFVSHRGFGFVLLSICEKPFLWSRSICFR